MNDKANYCKVDTGPAVLSSCPTCGKTRLDSGSYIGDTHDWCKGHITSAADIAALRAELETLRAENERSKADIARINEQKRWWCYSGGTDCEGQKENVALRAENENQARLLLALEEASHRAPAMGANVVQMVEGKEIEPMTMMYHLRSDSVQRWWHWLKSEADKIDSTWRPSYWRDACAGWRKEAESEYAKNDSLRAENDKLRETYQAMEPWRETFTAVCDENETLKIKNAELSLEIDKRFKEIAVIYEHYRLDFVKKCDEQSRRIADLEAVREAAEKVKSGHNEMVSVSVGEDAYEAMRETLVKLAD